MKFLLKMDVKIDTQHINEYEKQMNDALSTEATERLRVPSHGENSEYKAG